MNLLHLFQPPCRLPSTTRSLPHLMIVLLLLQTLPSSLMSNHRCKYPHYTNKVLLSRGPWARRTVRVYPDSAALVRESTPFHPTHSIRPVVQEGGRCGLLVWWRINLHIRISHRPIPMGQAVLKMDGHRPRVRQLLMEGLTLEWTWDLWSAPRMVTMRPLTNKWKTSETHDCSTFALARHPTSLRMWCLLIWSLPPVPVKATFLRTVKAIAGNIPCQTRAPMEMRFFVPLLNVILPSDRTNFHRPLIESLPWMLLLLWTYDGYYFYTISCFFPHHLSETNRRALG